MNGALLVCSNIPDKGRFYRRPLAPRDGSIKFSAQPVGINTLGKYMNDMFKEAGINVERRKITGHSGKVTCCTSLFGYDIPEQAIQDRSGHQSNVVQLYKRPSIELQQKVSDILQPPRPLSSTATITRSASKIAETQLLSQTNMGCSKTYRYMYRHS